MYLEILITLIVTWLVCLLISIALKKYSSGRFYNLEKSGADNANNILLFGLVAIGVIYLSLKINHNILKYFAFGLVTLFTLVNILQIFKEFGSLFMLLFSGTKKNMTSKELLLQKKTAHLIVFVSDLIEAGFFLYIVIKMFQLFF